MTDTAEQALREHLERHTAVVPGGPDLDRSLREGHRRRRTRALTTAGAAVAVAVLGAAAVVGLRGSDDRAADPVEPAAGPTDFVPGTDVDERFAALVAEHLPALPEADDVYPSDSDTAGPLPDGEFGRASEWQAVYTAGPDHQVLVLMGEAVPGEDAAAACEPPWLPTDQCSVEQQPGGGVVVSQRYSTDDGVTVFVSQVDADGFRVAVLDTRPTPERTLADLQRIRDLVVDPRFTFEPGS